MIFDFDNDGASWFDLDGGGRVQLKTLSYDDWREIEKATVKKGSPEYPKLEGRHERFQPDIIDDDLRTEMIWDKTIIGWEGVLDKHEKPIPCTKEWKLKLIALSRIFRNFYNEKMKVLIDAETGREALVQKNSSASQNGKSTKVQSATPAGKSSR